MRRPTRPVLVLLSAALGLVGLLPAVAFAMLFVGDPAFSPLPEPTPEEIAEFLARYEQPYPPRARQFRMREGTPLHAAVLPAARETSTTVVLVHGILASSQLVNRPAGLLRETLAATVVAVDLRGHGASGGPPGDIDYIGQYEDDLADAIDAVRRERPHGRTILAGHSMGGGIVLRYAQRVAARAAPAVDAYLLYAPHLGPSSPTLRTAPAAAGPELIALHVPRTYGLAFFNWAGITQLNGMRTLFFNLPPEMPLRSYSYRAMVGGAPENHRAALAAVGAPMLVLVGSEDEAFHADRYDEALRPRGLAELAIIEGATHDSILVDPRSLEAIRRWARALDSRTSE